MNGKVRYSAELLIVLVVLPALLLGCAGTAPVPATETAAPTMGQEDVLTWAVNWSIDTLDPSLVLGNEHNILFQVYETLTYWDPQKGAMPKLATSWEATADKTEWIFHLREGVKFHDGTPFNAEAVKFSLERTIQAGALAYIFASFQEIQVVDDLTVRFKLSYPVPMPNLMANAWGAFIMSPTMSDKPPEWFALGNGIGTGAYRFASFEPGQRLILVRNEEYWGGWREGQFATVVYRIVEDPTVRQQMVLAGEADITGGLSLDIVDSVKASGNVVVDIIPGFQSLQFHFRTTQPPFDDLRVRQAFAHAFPYELAESGTFGGYAAASTGAVPRVLWAPPTEPRIYEYDLDRARELLAEAGYAEGVTVTAGLYPGLVEDQHAMELWKAELAKIGVTLTIQQMSTGAFWDTVFASEPDCGIMWLRMSIGFASPSEFIGLFHSQWTWFPYSGWVEPRFEALVEEGYQKELTDPAGSDQAYAQAEQILYDDCVAVFALDTPISWFYRTDISGVKPSPLYHDFFIVHDLARK